MKEKNKCTTKQILKERGITLIALVITIIVLLILAGVALAALTGDSGILSNTEKAKENTEVANLKEVVSIKVMEHKIAPDSDDGIKKYLEELKDEQNVELEEVREDTFYVTKGNTTLTVYEDGEVVEGKAVWDGTSASPELKKTDEDVFDWYIYTPQQLKFLADYVNEGHKLTKTLEEQLKKAGYEEIGLTDKSTVYLMKDLDLGAREGEGDEESERWETETNKALEWTPIGNVNKTGKKFISTFEGNGNTIRGVYINPKTEELSSGTGLFGNIDSNSLIEKLTIENSYINGGTCTGGIVGALRSGSVENCHNINTTVILREGEYYTVGGVVGQTRGEVLNCSNTGKIVAKGMNEDGISQAGGIAGITNSTIINCYNTGEIIGNGKCTGGIVGNAYTLAKVSNCYNTGKITSNEECTGGVAGNANSETIINNCYNTGKIEGRNATGGIVGGMAQDNAGVTKSTVEKCYNSGSINGEADTGGIAGRFSGENGQGTVIQCYNKGKVEGTTNVGAVIGSQLNTTGLNTLNNLYYLNTVGIKAIGVQNGAQDDEDNNIMSTTEDIKTYKQFLEWIENK